MIKHTSKHTIIYLVADKTGYSHCTITLNFDVQTPFFVKFVWLVTAAS